MSPHPRSHCEPQHARVAITGKDLHAGKSDPSLQVAPPNETHPTPTAIDCARLAHLCARIARCGRNAGALKELAHEHTQLHEDDAAFTPARENNDPERRFTERLARQNDLLKRLRGTGVKPNITHLADDYNVSRKTILRDLPDLIQRGQLDESVYPDWRTERDP